MGERHRRLQDDNAGDPHSHPSWSPPSVWSSHWKGAHLVRGPQLLCQEHQWKLEVHIRDQHPGLSLPLQPAGNRPSQAHMASPHRGLPPALATSSLTGRLATSTPNSGRKNWNSENTIEELQAKSTSKKRSRFSKPRSRKRPKLRSHSFIGWQMFLQQFTRTQLD